MSHEPRWQHGHARKKLQLRLRAEARPCWICVAFGRSGIIDYSLRFPHPYSFEIDELVPVSKYRMGGYKTPEQCALDYSNLAATHRVCNQWRSNKTVAEVMSIAAGRRSHKRPPNKLSTSRDWSKEVDDAEEQGTAD